MSTGSPHLVLLTRVPVPGRVKTRLMGVLPGEQVTRRGGYSKVIDESNGDVKVGAIYG